MPAELPSVSIIVLNWNGRTHLAACLESLIKLEYPASKLQIILCDNGSTDGSVEFVKQRFGGVTLLALDRNYGFAEGNNRAAQAASGDWVGFLNNDMRVEPSWVRNLLAPVSERPDLKCVASRIVNWKGSAVDFVGGGINFQGHGFQIDHGEAASMFDKPRRLLFACGGAMLVRRDLFLEVGGFDADFFAFFEDVDLGWRLNLLGHDVWYTPEATAYHHHHGTARRIQPHQLQVLYERNALAMIYKCFDDDHLAAALPAAMLLLNERALRLSGLDRRRFDLEPDHQSGPGGPAADSTEAVRRRGLFERGSKVVREQGFQAAAGKAFRLLARSVSRVAIALLRWLNPDYVVLPGISVSHYVAESQFGHRLESLNKKRAWIQGRRNRSDAEILPLFVDPFYANYADARYLTFYRWLCRVQGLDHVFGRALD